MATLAQFTNTTASTICGNEYNPANLIPIPAPEVYTNNMYVVQPFLIAVFLENVCLDGYSHLRNLWPVHGISLILAAGDGKVVAFHQLSPFTSM